MGFLAGAGSALGGAASSAGGAIGSAGSAVGSGLSSAGSTVGSGLSSAGSTVGSGLSSVGNFLSSGSESSPLTDSASSVGTISEGSGPAGQSHSAGSGFGTEEAAGSDSSGSNLSSYLDRVREYKDLADSAKSGSNQEPVKPTNLSYNVSTPSQSVKSNSMNKFNEIMAYLNSRRRS